MTVGELIEKLQKLDKDAKVLNGETNDDTYNPIKNAEEVIHFIVNNKSFSFEKNDKESILQTTKFILDTCGSSEIRMEKVIMIY